MERQDDLIGNFLSIDKTVNKQVPSMGMLFL